MDHIYQGERCIFCNVNQYDAMLYDEDETCPDCEENFVYTTETGDSGPTDTRFAKRYDFFGYEIDTSNVQTGYDLLEEHENE